MTERHVILIVDDTPENLVILGDMLEQEGHEVLIATSGLKALEIIKVYPHPELVLLDIMMPDMDGYEVCRQLKADSELKMIPVIFISALGMQEQKIRAFREGAVDYITKPFMAEEVVARVNTHLRLTHIERLNREIAERKRAEEEKTLIEAQLQQAQKMESIGRLAGGVAHDFNNMLGVILGYAEMALEQVDQGQPLYKGLVEIRKAAERSSNITKQLLAFARKQTITPRVINLNDTVVGMLNMLKRLIGEDIHVEWIPGDSVWPVKIDPSQIDQILANLCVNARDAISGVGHVTIETENVVLDEDYCNDHHGFFPGEYVKLSVSDNGCGMDRITLSQVFEPFFTTKEVGVGTGLGLSMVYGIVKQNKGFINIHSEQAVGTTFTIYLSKHAEEIIPVRTIPQEMATTVKQETILLVEDEPTILKMTDMLLNKLGYTVLTASSPDEAILKAKNHKADIRLLITDVVMPDMNGKDLAETLIPICPGLKYLFMSGYTADVIAHQGILDEAVHFIQKPFSKNDLAIKVREALNSPIDSMPLL